MNKPALSFSLYRGRNEVAQGVLFGNNKVMLAMMSLPEQPIRTYDGWDAMREMPDCADASVLWGYVEVNRFKHLLPTTGTKPSRPIGQNSAL